MQTETKDYGPCTKCGQRPSTVIWVCEGDFNMYWCEQCVLEAQIAYAQEVASRLPGLEARLVKLRAEEPRAD